MRYAIALLAGLLAFSSNAQVLTVVQADSLRLRLRVNQADTNRVRALLQLGEYYQRRTLNYAHNLDTALVLAGQAQVLSQQLQYGNGQQEALFQQGSIFIRQEKLSRVKRMLSSVSELTRIRLLLELGKNKFMPTYSQEAHLDSALWYFSQAETRSERMGNQTWQEESQMLTGVAYVFKGDCERSRVSFMQVVSSRQRENDKAGELKAWLRWATTLHSEWKFCDQSADTLSRAFALARQLGDRPSEALLQVLVGYKKLFEGNLRQAQQEARKALTIQKAIGYPALNQAYHALLEENMYLSWVQLVNLSTVYALLGDISAQANDANKAILYNLEVVKDAERSGLREELDWPYFFIGNVYYDLGQYAKSSAYYQQSLNVSHQKGEVVVHIAMIRRMAELLLKEGKARQALQLLKDFTHQHLPLSYENKTSIAIGFGQCYAALKQYRLAEKYYLACVGWSRKNGETLESYSWRYISEFYLDRAQYARAAPYLKRLAAYAGPMQPAEKLKLYRLQFKVDSAQGNYSSALRHYQHYTALKDSLLNEKTSRQIAELDIRYQTSQKEQALKLREKDITLLTQQSQTQQTQRNALIGGTVLLVSLLGLGYNRYRLKQRSNQLLEAQQQQIHYKNQVLERLLKEVHHRVKNNLQIVMSLLNAQAAALQDPTALAAIQESQHRVQAMALIHQKLYQAEGVARITMTAYVQEVIAYLHESYERPQPIRFAVDVEPIELDVTQAVPLGLIINEAITNALKHAFPNGRLGTVEVKLHRLDGTGYALVIADDGVGLPADFDPALSRSLGMTLIRGFSEQLGGQLHVKNLPGLSICLQFQEDVNAVGL